MTKESLKHCKVSRTRGKVPIANLVWSINFIATFIQNLSKKTRKDSLNGKHVEARKRDVHFVLTLLCKNLEFNDIKQAICKATELVHFNPNNPLVIESDTSLNGQNTAYAGQKTCLFPQQSHNVSRIIKILKENF